MIKRVGRGERVNRERRVLQGNVACCIRHVKLHATLYHVATSYHEGHITSDVTVNRLTRSLSLARKLSLPLVLFAIMAEIPESAYKISTPGRAAAPGAVLDLLQDSGPLVVSSNHFLVAVFKQAFTARRERRHHGVP